MPPESPTERDKGEGQISAAEQKIQAAPNAGSGGEVLAQFQKHASFLQERHDRHERLVKLGRDATIESKRIISLLHQVVDEEPRGAADLHSETDVGVDKALSQKDGDRAEIFQKAFDRLEKLKTRVWKPVAFELEGQDPYMYIRAYTSGLQEYVEAISFYHFLKHGAIADWSSVQAGLEFRTPPPDSRLLRVMMPKSEFMMGLADVAGEVTRQVINSIGMGNSSSSCTSLNFLRDIHRGFVGVPREAHRELGRKVSIFESSVKKVENVCYNINVRCVEIPRDCLTAFLKLGNDEDRGECHMEYQD